MGEVERGGRPQGRVGGMELNETKEAKAVDAASARFGISYQDGCSGRGWIEEKGKGSEVSVRARLVQQDADVRRECWGPQAAHHLVTRLLRGGGPTHGVKWTSSGDLEPSTSFRTPCFPLSIRPAPTPTPPTVLGPGS